MSNQLHDINMNIRLTNDHPEKPLNFVLPEEPIVVIVKALWYADCLCLQIALP